MRRILSGIRATGDAQLGNYLGAIRNWVKLQDEGNSEIFLFIADLHALTTVEDTHNLKENSFIMAATYLACGIDPDKASIFCQSHVPSHTELSWVFGCLTPLGWLNRMTQFKDKAGKNAEGAVLGLYAYPVLMAADILIYKATHVPVGEDQKQHLELARDIAGAFNRRFNVEHFKLPEFLSAKAGTRVMSLKDGSSKMSKSDPSDYSRINLLDEDDMIIKKIQKAKTDAHPLPEAVKELEERLEAKNLLTIYAALSDQSLEVICGQMAGKNFATFKKELSDLLVSVLGPIRQKIKHYLSDEVEVRSVLKKGADKANAIAEKNLAEVYEIIGLLR